MEISSDPCADPAMNACTCTKTSDLVNYLHYILLKASANLVNCHLHKKIVTDARHAKGSASRRGAPKGLFDHILGNRRYLAKGLINGKGRSPAINSKAVM